MWAHNVQNIRRRERERAEPERVAQLPDVLHSSLCVCVPPFSVPLFGTELRLPSVRSAIDEMFVDMHFTRLSLSLSLRTSTCDRIGSRVPDSIRHDSIRICSASGCAHELSSCLAVPLSLCLSVSVSSSYLFVQRSGSFELKLLVLYMYCTFAVNNRLPLRLKSSLRAIRIDRIFDRSPNIHYFKNCCDRRLRLTAFGLSGVGCGPGRAYRVRCPLCTAPGRSSPRRPRTPRARRPSASSARLRLRCRDLNTMQCTIQITEFPSF